MARNEKEELRSLKITGMFAGIIGILLSTPGVLVGLDSSSSLHWPLLVVFAPLLALSIFLAARGVRAAARPPSLLFRLTHWRFG